MSSPPIGSGTPRAPRARPVHDVGLVEIRCNGVVSRQQGNTVCNALLCKSSPGSVVSIVCPKCGALLFAHVPLLSPFVVAPGSSSY